MSTDTFILVNQIISNRRLNQIEAELVQQKDLALQERLKSEQMENRRSTAFSVFKELQKIETIQLTHPELCYYYISLIFNRLSVSSITTHSFTEFQDKEYVSKLYKKANLIKSACRESLTESILWELHDLARMQCALPHIQNLNILHEIHRSIPRTPWYLKYTKHGAIFWIISLYLIQSLFLIPYFLFEEITFEMLGWALNTCYILTALILVRALWFHLKKKSAFSRLKPLADSIGLKLTAKTTRESFYQSFEYEISKIRHYEFDDSLNSPTQCQKLEKTFLSESGKIADTYSINL